MKDRYIQIQNIYYMLAYAFSILKENGYAKIAGECFENTATLLAAILIKGVTIQLKRGLGKEYIDLEEPLTTLRGKINLVESIKKQTIHKKQLVCCFDDLSINTKFNQIIKTTIIMLTKSDIKEEYKRKLKKLLLHFENVATVDLNSIDWKISYYRHNASYQTLINICYLVIKGLLQTENNGEIKIQNFLDHKRMCKLYEKFVLEYYKTHFPYLEPASPKISWNIEGSHEFLPAMQSDIILNPKGKDFNNKILIIDTKYYSKSMATSHYGSKKTFHSHNLYQIFTYVKNQDTMNTGNVGGMLLYAQTDEELSINAEFTIGGNPIIISHLDLNQPFENIEKKLHDIVHSFFDLKGQHSELPY